ncbi:unnamed protein product [Ectocarpus sp. 12 AP-2014]
MGLKSGGMLREPWRVVDLSLLLLLGGRVEMNRRTLMGMGVHRRCRTSIRYSRQYPDATDSNHAFAISGDGCGCGITGVSTGSGCRLVSTVRRLLLSALPRQLVTQALLELLLCCFLPGKPRRLALLNLILLLRLHSSSSRSSGSRFTFLWFRLGLRAAFVHVHVNRGIFLLLLLLLLPLRCLGCLGCRRRPAALRLDHRRSGCGRCCGSRHGQHYHGCCRS